MEIIPKEFSKPSNKNKYLNILLIFSLVLLFFSIASFFILDHFIEEEQKKLIPLKQILVEKDEKIESLKDKILPFQEKINNFSFIIDKHIQSLKFFTAFEKIVHPEVWFSEFNLDLKEKRVILSGQAQSFEALGQQLYIFRNKGKYLIKNTELEKVSIIGGEKINFSLFFILNSKFFND